jgi:hypothetical protein
MNKKKSILNIQHLAVSNEKWSIELSFVIEPVNYRTQHHFDKRIKLSESHNCKNLLIIKTNNSKTCLIDGIDGSAYLHSADENHDSYSVKLVENCVVFGLGFTFFSFDLEKQEIKWQIKPDIGGIFEFYQIENDYLVRGEFEIHRINNLGKLIWSFSGRDIWFNIYGEKEIQIKNDQILLADFENNKYVIDYNGKIINDILNIKREIRKEKKWWKLWL